MKAVSRPRRIASFTDDWAIELKWDGMRMQAHIGRGGTALYSGSGKVVTSGLPELALLDADVGIDAVLDGELVVFSDGRPSFSHLQQRIHVAQPNAQLSAEYPVVYLIFDLLSLDGHELGGLPYRERRRLLESLIDDGPAWKVPSFHVGTASALLELAETRGLEGIVAKRLESSYQPGRRSPDWVKVKIRHRQEFVVGGWAEGRNSLQGQIGSLVVGVQGPGGLAFAGSVGSGLTEAERARLAGQLASGPQPFAGDARLILDALPQEPHWVVPDLVVEIEYSLWPEGGSLWHPVYLGQRVDRDPADVVREMT
ncbi:MAG: non-homologous end-joining DNA ligase [Actinomycetota bacterium]|nr:non-homologous end-joining DNA ligase [Actinomycetota bacterium]